MRSMELFMLLSVWFMVLFIETTAQKYGILTNQELVSTNLTQNVATVSSLLECAMLGSQSRDAFLAVSFNNETSVCLGSTNHFPTIIHKIGSNVLQLQENDQLNDCSSLPANSGSGIYQINPNNNYRTINVYCEMTFASGGWTIVSRRFDGSVDFDREWNDYKNGFGNLSGEFWLGNENLHQITSRTRYQVRFDLTDFSGDTAHALYSTFGLATESTNYTLNLSGYSGTAGDSMLNNYLTSLSGSKFQTKDSGSGCPRNRKAGWWYRSCSQCNVLGMYQPGAFGEEFLIWKTWRNRNCLAEITTMIKPFP